MTETTRILKFEAPWCQPCKIMNMPIKSIEQQHGLSFTRVDIDTPEGHELATKHRVMSIPTLLITDAEGAEAARLAGVQNQANVEAFIRNNTNLIN